MPSERDNTKRWQFRLIWLFTATLVVACCCTLWIADPADWSIVASWALSLVLPAGSVSGAIFLRGYQRAFFTCPTLARTAHMLRYGAAEPFQFSPAELWFTEMNLWIITKPVE